jgi:hypothetical protein
MTVLVLGPLTLSGFAYNWYFLFLLVVLGLAGLYIIVQLSRNKRVLRFANTELLESAAPKRPSRWRAPGGGPAGVFVAAADRRDGRPDPRHSDSA